MYLQLAELCKRFFPASEVKNILATILPLLRPDVRKHSIYVDGSA